MKKSKVKEKEIRSSFETLENVCIDCCENNGVKVRCAYCGVTPLKNIARRKKQ